jgi:adenosylcobyric acid synthase
MGTIKMKAVPLMIQGTQSDAGKSIVVTALCRIFKQDGLKTAPFKSQNMALNSYITLDGKEMGRAQGVQAEAAGIIATTDMNPILIKPSNQSEAQIVVHGKPFQNMKALNYRSEFYEVAKRLIQESYDRLALEYDCLVIEGAGSPAEVNLNDRELVNMSIARMADAPVIIVADIDKGGVFASLVGTLQLLSDEDRNRVVGVLINKFRGDLSLLEPGLKWFEEYTGKLVLGVIPYMENLAIDEEDSLSLTNYSRVQDHSKEIDIALICYPYISNYTDVNPFRLEPDCHVRLVKNEKELHEPDLIILPGSKNTVEDLIFLKESGLAEKIVDLAKSGTSIIIGICGGYQMLGEKIQDLFGVESSHQEIDGLGLFPLHTELTQEKKTTRSTGVVTSFGKTMEVHGYEIHMGESHHLRPFPSFIETAHHHEGSKTRDERVMGTYFHGIFDNDGFRKELLNTIRNQKGLAPIENRLSTGTFQEEEFNRLAAHVRKSINLEKIYWLMKNFKKEEEDGQYIAKKGK